MSPRARDIGRARFYAAERMIMNMFDRVGSSRTVEIAGTQLTLPIEAIFGSVDSVRDHIERVLAMPAVRQRFPGAAHPVSVRARKGYRSAEYRPAGVVGPVAEIAIPVSAEGRWALRELTVLHELSHHFDQSHGAPHGSAFIAILTELVGVVLGPEAAFVYRVILADSGV
ncbi:MAG: TIGR04338 family metallohydrolase [Gordonia sp. (in: high G+C Gram-positive bacteria)]